ncbi:hypothetical protein CMEL01_11680, partial [Colletotrichum melonis]
ATKRNPRPLPDTSPISSLSVSFLFASSSRELARHRIQLPSCPEKHRINLFLQTNPPIRTRFEQGVTKYLPRPDYPARTWWIPFDTTLPQNPTLDVSQWYFFSVTRFHSNSIVCCFSSFFCHLFRPQTARISEPQKIRPPIVRAKTTLPQPFHPGFHYSSVPNPPYPSRCSAVQCTLRPASVHTYLVSVFCSPPVRCNHINLPVRFCNSRSAAL